MQVRDWMTANVEIVQPDDDVASVQALLRSRQVRQFPVASGGQLVGIITDRDVRSQRDPHTKVAAAMTRTPVVTTTPTTPVEEAAAELRGRKIGALPVMVGGELVGIISESDLLAALVELCHLLEPTTLIEVECDGGDAPLRRIRTVLEDSGGHIFWMSRVADPNGGQCVTLRLRMPPGHLAEQLLEEAGFVVVSCITGCPVSGPEEDRASPTS